MISKNFPLNISTCLSGKPFTLDELVMETKLLFENEDIPGFLKLFWSFIDDTFAESFRHEPIKSYCEIPKLIKNGNRCKKLYTSLGNIDVLLADGTGYKKFNSQKKIERENKIREKTGKNKVEVSKRGEIKIVMGIKENNEIVPLGAWTSESWKVIGRLIDKANNNNLNVIPLIVTMAVAAFIVKAWKRNNKSKVD